MTLVVRAPLSARARHQRRRRQRARAAQARRVARARRARSSITRRVTRCPTTAHFVHIGSGPASARAAVAGRRAADRARPCATWADAGVPFLAIATGWQLLGRELDGRRRHRRSPGPGCSRPSRRSPTTVSSARSAASPSSARSPGSRTTRRSTILDEGVDPARPASSADTAAATDEGVVAGELVGTNLHGAFLPMNPHWADRLLDAAIRLAGVQPADIDSRMFDVDAEARRARDAIRARLGLTPPDVASRTYSRGIRRLARTTISSPIVPAQAAQSSAVGSPASPVPKTIASSPIATSRAGRDARPVKVSTPTAVTAARAPPSSTSAPDRTDPAPRAGCRRRFRGRARRIPGRRR